jgi:dUTP pyrophosphatase
MSTLYIKASDSVRVFYEDHSTFHEGDSGLDIFFPEDVTINPGEVKKVSLGISCEMVEESIGDIDTLKKFVDYETILMNIREPFNLFSKLLTEKKNVSYYLYARSSISNTPLILANNVGIVDSNYRGTIIAALRNIGTEPYTVKRGERLVQICTGTLKPFSFKLVDELSVTTRGSNGFGSTGR